MTRRWPYASRKIDVFCQISDGLTNASFPAISRACESTKTPLFSFASGQIKIGAILSVGSDYDGQRPRGGAAGRPGDPRQGSGRDSRSGLRRRSAARSTSTMPAVTRSRSRKTGSRRPTSSFPPGRTAGSRRNEMKGRPWIARSAAPTTSPWS